MDLEPSASALAAASGRLSDLTVSWNLPESRCFCITGHSWETSADPAGPESATLQVASEGARGSVEAGEKFLLLAVTTARGFPHARPRVVTLFRFHSCIRKERLLVPFYRWETGAQRG